MSQLALPGNVIRSSAVMKRVAGADPAAGVECSDAVPAGKFWWLVSYTVQCVQGATQTPLPMLQIDDGVTVLVESPGSSAVQAAATTCTYTWSSGLVLTGQIGATPNIRSVGGLSDLLLLPAGYRVRTITPGIGANTNYGAPQIYVCEFSTQ